ncbi:hypothetical protein DFH06DRAFT_1319159 [Mycena polygramma]|nr:hypothetical protein DFH06DRAFT_1319159 [Mycena polygramma]
MTSPIPQQTSFASLAPEIVTIIWSDLPRPSKTHLLSVCRAWNVEAEQDKFLWTDLSFGPASTKNDLPVASKWLLRSGSLPLSVTILRDPKEIEGARKTVVPLTDIFSTLAPASERIQTLFIDGSHTNAELVNTFLCANYFAHVTSLAIVLESHWMTIIHDGVAAAATLAHHPPIFHPLNLPLVHTLHVSNFPFFWPTAPGLITEVVLGPTTTFRPSLGQLKTALESAPTLQRLGFLREFAGLRLAELATEGASISLPSLHTLSLRNTPPECFQPFLSILNAPMFTALVIALGHDVGRGEDEISHFIGELQSPSTVSRLRALTIQALDHPCPPSFFAAFHELEVLRLDFSSGALSNDYWMAIADPVHAPLPALRELSVVNIYPPQAQEVVLLRSRAGQQKLQHLELSVPLDQVPRVRSPKYVVGLASKECS